MMCFHPQMYSIIRIKSSEWFLIVVQTKHTQTVYLAVLKFGYVNADKNI